MTIPRDGQSAWKRWTGIGLVGLSGVWFALIFLVQFMGLALEARAALSTAFFLLMEGTFYLGAFLVGKQLLSRYFRSVRAHLRF